MAYNSLTDFDFDYLDQVGSLSSLRVNISYNKITDLRNNTTSLPARDHGGSLFHSNIKQLDMSHNNITHVLGGFFRPAEISLTHLYLGHNYLVNMSRDVFGSMPHLQWLDLSYNQIDEVDYDTFKNTRRLQVINLSHNKITDIPMDFFRYTRDIRIINLSFNFIRGLHENFFGGDGIQYLDLSHNLFTKVPALALSNLAALTLAELDLSHNNIAALQSIDLSNKFRSLSWLDLSHNLLIRLEDAAFATLPRLNYLDLSHNKELEINGKVFIGLENTLTELKLQNISLDVAPDLALGKLESLNLALNELPTIPQQLAENLTNLRKLDLSYNDLTIIPEMIRFLPDLRSLSLAGNPITTLTNTTMVGITDDLEELNIANLDLHEFEYGVFHDLQVLRSLHLSAYPGIPSFNILKLIECSYNLRTLGIHGPQPRSEASVSSFTDGISALVSPKFQGTPSDFNRELNGDFPYKVRKIIFEGHLLNRLADDILQGVRSPVLHIVFRNTSITNLPEKLFNNLDNVRNITLDFDHTNQKLTKIPNPNNAQYPNSNEKTYLTDLDVEKMSLSCDCELGWIEFWQRKTRQYVCTSQSWAERSFNPPIKSMSERDIRIDQLCNEHSEELRMATCSNKKQELLIEVLKTDLECGWGSRASLSVQISVLVVFGTVFLTILI